MNDDALDMLFTMMMPPFREPKPWRPRPDAIRIERHGIAPVQVGPVGCSGDVALYDCPCGCGLWTREPAKMCSYCNELKPATHWDTLVDTCGDCADRAYGD